VGYFSIYRGFFGYTGEVINSIYDKKQQKIKKTKPTCGEVVPKEGFVIIVSIEK
jgi:hypothetical protein